MRALANALAQAGDSVDLLTTLQPDHAMADGDGDPARIATFPRAMPRRLCRSPSFRRHLHSHKYDFIHHHALWLLTLHYAHEAAEKSRVPLVISPRGMMSGRAYHHHHWRKVIASHLVHPGAFHAAAGWHATSPGEADDIRKLGFSQPICVSPNGVVLAPTGKLSTANGVWERLCPASRSRPIALFYSRLHRKKRLLELIDLWLAGSRGDWHLLVVGVAEEYTAAEMTARVAASGAAEKITVIDGSDPAPALRRGFAVRAALSFRKFRVGDRRSACRGRACARHRHHAVGTIESGRLRLMRSLGKICADAPDGTRDPRGRIARHRTTRPHVGRKGIFLGKYRAPAAGILRHTSLSPRNDPDLCLNIVTFATLGV